MKRFYIWSLLIICLLVLLGVGMAQFPKIKIKIPKKIPGLNKILKSKPPLTTSIANAVTEVPFLDDFDPETAWPMTSLQRTTEGGFILEYQGNFMFECQSYCLRAGTYAPGEGRGGRGYLYAPLKGPQADIVSNLLKKSYLHPEIPQKDIQVLLWAVISRTKIKKMSPEIRYTAAKLLTPKEIFRINGGALGLIPRKFINKAFENLPSSVRRVMEAEARLRTMLTKTQASYEELERIAVLNGEPPHEEGDREVPLGRWSFHPDGYFIRYFPRGYKRMLIELYYPEPVQIKMDKLGRIIFIADQKGNRLETVYNDTIETLVIPGETSLKGYSIRSLRLVMENSGSKKNEKKRQREWKKAGWTFLGVPTGGGKISSTPNRFSDSKDRYQWALDHKMELNNLYQGLKKLGRLDAGHRLNSNQMDEIMALGHYAIALQKAIGNHNSELKDWRVNPVELVKIAWQSTVAKYLSTCQGTPVFNPADDPVPGQAGSQIGGDSGRESDEGKTCDQKYETCMGEAHAKLTLCLDKCYEKYGDEAKEKGCDLNGLINCLRKAMTNDATIKCIWTYCKTETAPGKLPGMLIPCLADCVKEYSKNKSQCFYDHVNCND
ncbi:MAG: hypothetical protein KAT17_08710 [Candidatus Aminicenantes bacterium]|nr:hypothetical protein [Candidatus Aminicenantes bacterium]